MHISVVKEVSARFFTVLIAAVVMLPLGPAPLQAQDSSDSSAPRDTGTGDTARVMPLPAVVVTATRSARTLEDLPVPTTLLTQDAIEAQGAVRLDDLLAEQPGLTLTYDHGPGLQVQGLGADYTLVLINGEPIIGRTAGTLSLDRIAVAGARRVEVVRGPSSSLYGSEALAGVINVITEAPQRALGGTVRTRYGTHGTTDVSARVEGSPGPLAGRLFLDRYASSGYDLTPGTATPTAPSFATYTARGNLTYALGARTDLTLRGRLAREDQESAVEVTGEPALFDRTAQQTDGSLASHLRHQVRPGLDLEASFYGSGYRTTSDLRSRAGGPPLDDSRYRQRYGKAEAQLQAVLGERHLVTAGAGLIRETVDADRVAGTRTGGFFFAQDEWTPLPWLDLVPSARLDAHSDYRVRLSPKLAALAEATDWLRLRASVGGGYKAPAFRQLYLDFTNPQAGYSVFGAEGVQDGLRRLDEQDQIQTYLRDTEPLGAPIEAESSVAFNAGLTAEPAGWLSVRANVFHNEISNLIDTQPVATKTNGQQVFTYFNLSEVFTRGAELEATLRPVEALAVTTSYTYLDAKDRQVMRDLEAGRVYRRTLTGRDVRVPAGDYGGLRGRSRHRATLRLTYAYQPLGLTAAVRSVWRGRYGFAPGRNGNGIVDTDAEYAPGYALLHVTLTKTLFGDHAVQVGAENLTGHHDAAYVPALSGRRWFAGLNLRF